MIRSEKKSKRSEGFTLIELLVVISIISLLSSIIFASLSNARDKGRIAGGLQFSTYNYRAFGADAIVFFDFNSGSAINQSQYNFVPAVGSPGTGVSYSNTDTPSGKGYSAHFDGTSNGYIKALSSNPVSLGTTQTNTKFTASAWVKPDPTTGDSWFLNANNNSCVEGGGRVVSMYRNSSSGALAIYTDGFIFSPLSIIPASKWTQVAYTWDGSKFNFYIDGRFIESQPIGTKTMTSLINCVEIGNSFQGSGPLKGNIDDVSIYNSALASKDIERLYAEGLPTHSLAEAK